MSGKKVADYRKRIKISLVEGFHHRCHICGAEEIPEFYEFHHIDPSKKEFQICSGNTHKKDDYISEAKKCVMVCPNCHRKIELGIIKPLLKSDFDEEIFAQTLEELKEEAKEKHYCVNCGKEISGKYTRCKECYDKIKFKVNEIPEKEELAKLIKEESFVQIGKRYGVSDNAIRKWCRKYDLPTTKKAIREMAG